MRSWLWRQTNFSPRGLARAVERGMGCVICNHLVAFSNSSHAHPTKYIITCITCAVRILSSASATAVPVARCCCYRCYRRCRCRATGLGHVAAAQPALPSLTCPATANGQETPAVGAGWLSGQNRSYHTRNRCGAGRTGRTVRDRISLRLFPMFVPSLSW